jgi:hypothetical protein
MLLLSIIKFSPEFGIWSGMIFWMVVVSIILTLGFTVAVFFGGLSDLRYLLKAMDEEVVDETDDGRVIEKEKQPAPRGFEVVSNKKS